MEAADDLGFRLAFRGSTAARGHLGGGADRGDTVTVLTEASGPYLENCNEARGVDHRGGPGEGGVAGPTHLDEATANGCGRFR